VATRRVTAPAAARLAGPNGSFLTHATVISGSSGQGPCGSRYPGRLAAPSCRNDEIAVNSLHNQGINKLAPGLVAEGVAPGRHDRGGSSHRQPGWAMRRLCRWWYSGTRNMIGARTRCHV